MSDALKATGLPDLIVSAQDFTMSPAHSEAGGHGAFPSAHSECGYSGGGRCGN